MRDPGHGPVVIVVTGSRYLSDPGPVKDVLSDFVGRPVLLYHGDNPGGVDTHAHYFAVRAGWDVRRHPARWFLEGVGAGPLRNGEMVLEAKAEAARRGWPAVCLGFPGPSSTGTPDCMRKARAAGMEVRKTPVPE